MKLKNEDILQRGDVIYYRGQPPIIVAGLAGKRVCQLPGKGVAKPRVERLNIKKLSEMKGENCN